MGTTYQTEPVLGEYKTAKQDKAVYWWASAIFHWRLWSKYLALIYLYHVLEIFGALSLRLGFFRCKVSGRLQNSQYFCVFKYARAVKQKVWNTAENRERDWGETFFFSRLTHVRLARFARIRLLRHALPISLLILRKKLACVQTSPLPQKKNRGKILFSFDFF